MSNNPKYQADVNILGGGIAGIVTALELLDQNLSINIFERGEPSAFGGLARWSFGGIFFVDTKHQRKNKIADSVELAKQDWYNFAEFSKNDVWPKKWADYYIENCTLDVYEWLKYKKIKFFPVVHWVERGLYQPGNSVPRFHMVWGTGHELIKVLVKNLEYHPKRENLSIFFRHKVEDFVVADEPGGAARREPVDRALRLARSSAHRLPHRAAQREVRARRHHAPGRAEMPGRARHRRVLDLRQGRERAAPAPLRGEQRVPGPAGGERHAAQRLGAPVVRESRCRPRRIGAPQVPGLVERRYPVEHHPGRLPGHLP